MKRFVFLLLIALVMSGAVWGQYRLPDMFDVFNAVPTMSTESRYSAGIFDSDADNFIDVRSNDPKIGTFLFLGGYPSGSTVDDTDNLTAGGNPYAISFGLGKTIDKLYLGVYYGGSFVNASGDYDPGDDDNDIKQSERYSAVWQNNLAVLLNLGKGALRFDMIMNNTQADKETSGGKNIGKMVYDSKIISETSYNSPAIAFTLGGKFSNLTPYVTLGLKFADLEITGAYDSDDKYQQYTFASGAMLGLQGGVNFDLKKNASASADLVLNIGFGSIYSGDTKEMLGFDPWTEGGAVGFGLRGAYSQKIDMDKISVGFKPSLALGLTSYSGKTTQDDVDDQPSNDYFELKVGVDVGLMYKVNKVFTLYTGGSFTFFDWTTTSHFGGEEEDESTSWTFSGIEWDASKFNTSGSLGIGLTFTPAKNIVIGAGLNSLLDKFFTINLQDMTVNTGFDNTNSQNLGDWATYFVRDLKFDLTVSCKF